MVLELLRGGSPRPRRAAATSLSRALTIRLSLLGIVLFVAFIAAVLAFTFVTEDPGVLRNDVTSRIIQQSVRLSGGSLQVEKTAGLAQIEAASPRLWYLVSDGRSVVEYAPALRPGLPIDIRLSAHMSKLRFRPRSYSYLGAVPVLDVFDRPIADWDIVVKWLFDKFVGALALIALSPVMLVTAIAIKLDSKGPVFFRQKRYGFNNETVDVLKFRSLRHDMTDHTAAKQVTKDDPRVTRVGRFIRKTSIDELPQLINVVFNGNLSLVGPRPHAIHAKASNRAYEQVVDGYFARHKVKPGITGWAQINGWRGETDTDDKIQRRVEHDLYYIENWSVLLDLYILLKTPFSLLTKNENAY